MRIAELYQSIQGEGLLTGVKSVFVRASGCNLRCWFCDTPYASWRPEGEDLSVEEIVGWTSLHDCRHVVITGGEPMLFAEMLPLCQALNNSGRHVTIETAGTLYLPVACDLMSISPKLAGSTPTPEQAPRWSERHERTRHKPEVIRRLVSEYDYQIKFVVDRPQDLDEIEAYLDELPAIDRGRVLLMPQGVASAQLAKTALWLEPLCLEHGFTFCPRKHIEWFGLQRRT